MPATESDGAHRILLVEDDALIGLAMKDVLESLGFVVDGPKKSVRTALAAIEQSIPRIAILDVTLRDGETSAPIAQDLRKRAVPFLFLTGYGSAAMPEIDQFAGAPRLAKPVEFNQLRHQITALLDRPQPSRPSNAG